MKEVCFYCVYDFVFKDMAKGMVRSVKRFYPDIPFIEFEIEHREKDGVFDLENYTDGVLEKGSELLGEYKRIIYMDPDQIMYNKCPDLFDDCELGVVGNNHNIGPEGDGTNDGLYINAGLVVCANKEVWEEITKEYQKRNATSLNWYNYNHQNALNYVYHKTAHKKKLLEFDDRVYGITGLAHYEGMELRDKNGAVCLDKDTTPADAELYLPSNKKLYIFHAAGTYWKTNNHINFNFIKNELARTKLINYTLKETYGA